ncbi:MAG TPA: FecR domain-containing protein [Candidatus Eisenbacteria bacterium]|jgi:hypothetical protein
MTDRYLWDRTGDPDPEVQRLERMLGRLAHRGGALDLSSVPAPARPRWRGWMVGRLPGPAWAAAAAVAMVVGLGGLWLAVREPGGWEVTRLEGAPRVGAEAMGSTGRLPVGQWLETDAASRARIRVGRIGLVEIDPDTRVRLVDARRNDHRLALARGVLHALILAPPRRFFVETPSAVAVDLGCAYTLEVDASGSGLVTVMIGWASFERNGRESFIPAGARCATRPGLGPGTPYFADASAGLKNALAAFDLAAGRAEKSAGPLGVVLAEARREDALTLWHLLGRTAATERGKVYDRLASLVPPPPSVTREGVLVGDHVMIDRWWTELGFGGTQAWRKWKGKWPEVPRSVASQ